ncbi:hypothetical protein Tco_1484593 [Tanacetum coccineum]
MKCFDAVTKWFVKASCRVGDAVSSRCEHKSSRVLVLLRSLVLVRERNEEYEVLQFNEEFSNLRRDFMDSLNILFQDLIQPHYSEEDISNDFVFEDELRLCLEDEERMRLEHDKNIIEERRFRVEEAKRMRLEEDKLLQIAELKKRRHEFMNSTHVKSILGKLTHSKRNHIDIVPGKTNSTVSWVKINKHRQNVNDPSLLDLLKKVKP